MISPLDLPEKIPFEDWEQRQVIIFCDDHEFARFRVPNETYTTSKMQMGKNKRLGVSAGVPDMFVIVYGQLIAIEMKRIRAAKPSTSADQKRWLQRLIDAGIDARRCYGHEEAIDFIREIAAAKGHPIPYDDSPF